MTAYTWTISSGGTITAGSTTNQITVTWNTTGAQTVAVNYINGNGCTAVTATSKSVAVNQLPVPTITGSASVCVGTTGVTYATEASMTGYSWTVSSGGTITSGSTTYQITVTWNTAGAQTVTVNYTNGNGCTPVSATIYNVIIIPFPEAAGSITGTAQVQLGQTGVAYSIPAIQNATGYQWTLPQGAAIASGSNTNSITVDFSASALPGNISVHGTNACGNGTESPLFAIYMGYDIAGVFTYNNSVNTPLDSVKVYLKKNGIKIDSTFTTSTGNYLFQGIGNDTYTIGATTTKPWSGINGTDALKVQRYFAGLEPFTVPIRLVAADVNNNNYVNGTDALKIKRRYVGLDTIFDRGNWTFGKINGGDTIIVNGADVAENLYGLCVGDVNGSNIPGPGAKSISSIGLTYNERIFALAGDIIEVPLKVQNSLIVGAVSMVMEYPKELMQIIDISVNQGSVTYKAGNGHLRLAWSEITPMELLPGESIIKLKIKTSNDFLPDSEIRFALDPTSEINNARGVPFTDLYLGVPVIIYKSDYSNGVNEQEFESLKVYPNPARKVLNVEYQLKSPGQIKIEMISMLGQSEFIYDSQLERGEHQLKLDISKFTPAVYSLVISCENNGQKSSVYKRVVILK